MTAKVGQIITIDSEEFVIVYINDFKIKVKDLVKGESQTLSKANLEALKGYSITDKTYKDLIDCDLWVKARILEALDIKFTIEVLKEING